MQIEGRRFLVVNCLAGDLSAAHRATGSCIGTITDPTPPRLVDRVPRLLKDQPA